ncbi:MAG: helix-hairpin-helix domain-containing protein [Verrucomicrobiae bacterium]|nr:helix-hairpin-helix domain-containing protein [Verrucomicrobiae bacterium]
MTDTWQPAPYTTDEVHNSGVLWHEVNEVSAEQLRRIFELDPTISQRIVEHRSNAGRIADVQELLGIEGMTPELLAHLTAHEDDLTPNADLQRELGLPDQEMAPVPDLLNAFAQRHRLEGLAVITSLGVWVGGGLPANLSQEHFLEQVPMTVHDLSEDLSKIDVTEPPGYSLSADGYDVVIQRAGVLLLLAVQPPDAFDLAAGDQLTALRREMMRRFRPRLYVAAPKTAEDILFDCPQCHQRVAIDHRAAGFEIDCPGCSIPLIVPEHSLIIAANH